MSLSKITGGLVTERKRENFPCQLSLLHFSGKYERICTFEAVQNKNILTIVRYNREKEKNPHIYCKKSLFKVTSSNFPRNKYSLHGGRVVVTI